MSTQEKIKKAKENGYSIKLIANLTDINVNTIYAFTSGKRQLSPEKEEKINKVLDTFNINYG